ncbi:MAG TPA: D-alanyl-D-alanine carboxypeptidase/D-alanyl-D-alanine-endopeptidase [Vicinamibacteria bacterium]
MLDEDGRRHRSRAAPALALALASALAAAPAWGRDPSPRRLAKAIDAILSRPEFAPALWGVEVRSLATGRTLYARNAEKAFRPASSMKLVTSAAALDAFGPEARIRTTVETAGRIDGFGRVLGDVFLVGRGDPNLSARFSPGRPTAAFEAMADALAAAGVRRIEGRLIGHEGAFTGDRRGSGWTWEDLAWGYGTEVSALSFSDNRADVALSPGERPGDPVLLDVMPDTGCLSITSAVVTAEATPAGEAGEGDGVTLVREPGSNDVRLDGRLPIGTTWEDGLAVSDPARCAVRVFQQVLQAKGIRVSGGAATSSGPLPAGARVLAAHEGAAMAEMVRVVNKRSQNLHAEMLLRLLGLRAKGEGTADAGHEAVAAFLARLGVPDAGWGRTDGSGLARTNLLTPAGLVSLLTAMDRHPQAAAFRESFPIAGIDGTLEKRMRGTPAEGRVLGKTGTLNQASALAGYVTTVHGERLAFAILVNNHAGRGREGVEAIDAIATALAKSR